MARIGASGHIYYILQYYKLSYNLFLWRWGRLTRVFFCDGVKTHSWYFYLYSYSWSHCNLSYYNQQYYNLSYCNLFHYNLSYCNLFHCNLFHYNLSYCNLFYYSLSYYNLFYCNLFYCKESGRTLRFFASQALILVTSPRTQRYPYLTCWSKLMSRNARGALYLGRNRSCWRRWRLLHLELRKYWNQLSTRTNEVPELTKYQN